MTKKVYVITKGNYSDYHICAVASNMETAEHLRKYYSSEIDGNARIEEYDLNGKTNDVRLMYRVEFRKGVFMSVDTGEYENQEYVYAGPLFTVIYVKAADEAHAVKIAQDRMAEYLAGKEGIV